MKCSKVKNLLADYANNDLKPDIKLVIKNHLSKCSDCREELKYLKKYIKEISSMPEVKAPKNFLDQIHNRLEKETASEKIISKLFFPLKIKIPLEAAGVLAMAALVILIFNPFEPAKLQYHEEAGHLEAPLEKTSSEIVLNLRSRSRPKGFISEDKKSAPLPLKEKPSIRDETEAEETISEEKILPSKSLMNKRKADYFSKDADQPKTYDVILYVKEKSKTEGDDALGSAAADKPEDSAISTSPGMKIKKRSYGKKAGKVSEKSRPAKRDIKEIESTEQIKTIARSLNGKLTRKIYDEKTKSYKYIIVEIPARNYSKFVKRLNTNWSIKRQQPARLPEKFKKKDRVELNLKFKD